MSADMYPPAVASIDLGRATKWMFASPNWLVNFFWVLVCGLLGVIFVGHILFIGYQLEIFQNRARGRADGQADFKLDKLGIYFMRGLIPFALNFVFGILLVVVLGVILAGWTLIFGTVFGEPEGALAALYIIPVIAIAFLVACAAFFTIVPLCIRGGLTNNFAEGFNFPWAIETAQLMWPTMLLCVLYLFLLAVLGQLVGVFTCGLGFLFVIPWMQLAVTDVGIQAYDVYESKGGTPIPMDPI